MRKITDKIANIGRKAKAVITSNKAEGFVDSGVKILISVVIGALLLAGLYTLFGDTIMPTLTSKIVALFNYTGTQA
ncbi:MAG: DUF6133 family protein [Clostridia bacterium]